MTSRAGKMLTAAHTCHARLCKTEVPPVMLMCRKHWSLVPKWIQNGVWRSYRPRQCDDKKPSATWLIWATKAIEEVAKKEAIRPFQAGD